jgi:hypothetical protein
MKLAFQSNTFASCAFRSDTWAGSRIRDMFCGSFASQADFLTFVSAFNAAIANASQLSAADREFLDLYDDGVVGYDDRDAWLHYLLRVNGFTSDRLPWTNPTDSDPLGLRGTRPHVVIIDPQNAAAVKVTRGTNNCTLQDGTTAATPAALWNGDTYNHKLWYDLESLDEGNNFGGGAGVNTRRFPTNGGEITVYVRGGKVPDFFLELDVVVHEAVIG